MTTLDLNKIVQIIDRTVKIQASPLGVPVKSSTVSEAYGFSRRGLRNQ